MNSTIAIVGRGRLGRALAPALRAAGRPVEGPHGRGYPGSASAAAVLFCVPDAEIATAAAALARTRSASQAGTAGPLVGHTSGATALDVLAPHEAFGLHPLMTVTEDGARLAGAAAAVAGSTPRALAFAHELATDLELRPVELDEDDRAAYHAAASMASNFLVTLEAAAERLAASAGVERELLVPLVRASVENWARAGGSALTGPIARGDAATVARQRAAVQERCPDLVALFDALAAATRELARVPA
jgi:predicted short-subunit dehydrogenase-like oxidoreductase (DUF2520 family)